MLGIGRTLDMREAPEQRVEFTEYRNIRPEGKISLEECFNFWDNLFSCEILDNISGHGVQDALNISNVDVGENQDKVNAESDGNHEYLENNEGKTRELTDEEKQMLRDKLGWSDEKLKKCTIDKDGIIHYRTDRCDLEGKISENGVPYERKVIEINGVKIEGVFPI